MSPRSPTKHTRQTIGDEAQKHDASFREMRAHTAVKAAENARARQCFDEVKKRRMLAQKEEQDMQSQLLAEQPPPPCDSRDKHERNLLAKPPCESRDNKEADNPFEVDPTIPGLSKLPAKQPPPEQPTSLVRVDAVSSNTPPWRSPPDGPPSTQRTDNLLQDPPRTGLNPLIISLTLIIFHYPNMLIISLTLIIYGP